MTDPAAHTPDSAGATDVDTLVAGINAAALPLPIWTRQHIRKLVSDLAAAARETVAAKETHWAQARFEQRRWREQKERAEAAEADRDRLREELAESRRHADGMARAPYGEFEAMREERDRLARRVAELENRLNTDSQDFEIRCLRETERTLRERVAELEAREQDIRELFGDGGGA